MRYTECLVHLMPLVNFKKKITKNKTKSPSAKNILYYKKWNYTNNLIGP